MQVSLAASTSDERYSSALLFAACYWLSTLIGFVILNSTQVPRYTWPSDLCCNFFSTVADGLSQTSTLELFLTDDFTEVFSNLDSSITDFANPTKRWGDALNNSTQVPRYTWPSDLCCNFFSTVADGLSQTSTLWSFWLMTLPKCFLI
jgi:hypothetical protein